MVDRIVVRQIEDGGVGSPAEDRNRGFEAGYSGTESDTGVGLTNVERIVDGRDRDLAVGQGAEDGGRIETTGIGLVAPEWIR